MCGEPSASRTCTRCKLVQYCSKVCQVMHWREGGHRESCGAAPKAISSVPEVDALIQAMKKGDIALMKLLFSQNDLNKIEEVKNSLTFV
jgi:hypothetical protein